MMDEETFMDEVEAMERALYRVSRSLLKSPEDCADAVQEALARARAQARIPCRGAARRPGRLPP